MRMSPNSPIKIDRDPDPVFVRKAEEVIKEMDIELQPVSVEQAAIARAAYRDFGKGSGIRRSSISAIASPTRWPLSPESLCCTREMTSSTPASDQRSDVRNLVLHRTAGFDRRCGGNPQKDVAAPGNGALDGIPGGADRAESSPAERKSR
jgi:hypothetical protein